MAKNMKQGGAARRSQLSLIWYRFRKNKLADPQSVEYVERFLLESCYGEIGHFFSLFFGFTVLFLYPLSDVWFSLAIPVAIVNFFLNLPSILVLRYNSYKLVVLKKSLLKKQQRKNAVEKNAEIAPTAAE